MRESFTCARMDVAPARGTPRMDSHMSDLELPTASGRATWRTSLGERSAPLTASLLRKRLYDAEPIRASNRYPRQRHYIGHYLSQSGKHVGYESLLERDVLRRLDFANEMLRVASQPVRLSLGTWNHTPDFLFLAHDGTQTVVDVKPTSRVGRFREQFETTARICEAVGWGYRVMSELEPTEEVNIEFLVQHRTRTPGLTEEIWSAAVEFVGDGAAFYDFAMHLYAAMGHGPTAQAAALHMLWSQAVTFDLARRLTHQTPVWVPAGSTTGETYGA